MCAIMDVFSEQLRDEEAISHLSSKCDTTTLQPHALLAISGQFWCNPIRLSGSRLVELLPAECNRNVIYAMMVKHSIKATCMCPDSATFAALKGVKIKLNCLFLPPHQLQL